MKKRILLILFVIAGAGFMFAQESSYFDSPFGGGIGYNPGWYKPNIDGLNAKVTGLGIPEVGKNGVFTSGGGGFLYIGFVKNLRIGGMWASGSTSQEAFVQGFRREADYSIGMGAFSIEYTLPFVKDAGISIGALIGGGTQKLEVYQSRFPDKWDDLWGDFSQNASTKDVTRIFKNSYFLLSPTINVDIPLYRFLSFRLGAGYAMKFGTAWTVDNNRSVSDTPSDLTGDSFFIQTGIYIGFFSF
jgi:hypothetical protein